MQKILVRIQFTGGRQVNEIRDAAFQVGLESGHRQLRAGRGRIFASQQAIGLDPVGIGMRPSHTAILHQFCRNLIPVHGIEDQHRAAFSPAQASDRVNVRSAADPMM
jgi:hypothetical protein